MLSKLTVRRLTKLADYMDALPPAARKHFDMKRIFVHKGRHDLSAEKGLKKESYFDCGSSACALGWAATIPSFKRAGLKLTYTPDNEDELTFNGDYVDYWDMPNTSPFDLSLQQAEYLFGAKVKVKTPKQWAKRCRKFLKANA